MNKYNDFNNLKFLHPFFDNIDFEKSLIFIPKNRILNDKHKETINKIISFDNENNGWYISSEKEFNELRKNNILISEIDDIIKKN